MSSLPREWPRWPAFGSWSVCSWKKTEKQSPPRPVLFRALREHSATPKKQKKVTATLRFILAKNYVADFTLREASFF